MKHYNKLMNFKDRENLPINGPGNYKIDDSKVYCGTLEINAVKHCNFTCKGCSHASPISKCEEYNLNVLKFDLNILSKFFRCKFLRLVGGEPLLHSNLTELLKIIKDSNISEKICLVTNGILLDKLSEEDLKYIDKCEISLYPLADNIVQKIKLNAHKLSEKNIDVQILEYKTFRESLTLNKSTNKKLVQEIYETCQIAHTWRCLTVDNGYFFRCPQSMVYCYETNNFDEALTLENLKNVEQLLNFLENNNSLECCKKCLGSVGKKYNHKFVNRDDWKNNLPKTIEDAIDLEYLNQLKNIKQFESDNFTKNKLS